MVTMMKVYVHVKNGIINDYDTYQAYYGFYEMGKEIIFFETMEELKNSKIEDVIVSYIGPIRSRLNDFGKSIENIDYPQELNKYLGRKIWLSTSNTINSNPDLWPVFMKPIENKRFKGRVIASPKDLIRCGSYYEDYPVYCSEVKDFIAEFRVFVLYGEIIDVRRYSGRWDVHCDKAIVEACVHDFINAPNAYALDFGITSDNQTLLIEIKLPQSHWL